MQFKVFTVAAMLLFWTSTTLAKKCNNRGEKWKDLGSDAELDTAFGKICDHMAGTYEPNRTVTFCQNVKKNRINVAISFYLVDGDQSDVTFDDNSGCLNALKQARSQAKSCAFFIHEMDTNSIGCARLERTASPAAVTLLIFPTRCISSTTCGLIPTGVRAKIVRIRALARVGRESGKMEKYLASWAKMVAPCF